MRYGMILNTKRCMGCNACTIICKQKNATPPGVFWARVYTQEIGAYPDARIEYLPAICFHCENPPCVDVCPTGATFQMENGTVQIDQDVCIGCRACMVACPYSARYFLYKGQASYYPEVESTPYEKARSEEHLAGTVGKCDLCIELVEDGEVPSCVAICPTFARIFGDFDDPESEVSKLLQERDYYQMHPELGTNPSVYYLPSG